MASRHNRGVKLFKVAVAIAVGYGIGSIPTGLWVGKLERGVDVREHGSGGTGATNVLRTLGAKPAALTLGLDAAKGATAVLVARMLGAGRAGEVSAGVSAMIGHSWPALAEFRGGKGVATAAGGLLAISPATAGISVLGGSIALATTRRASVGSLVAASSATAYAAINAKKDPAALAFSALATALIVARHRANVQRLIDGEEPTVNLHSRAPELPVESRA